MTTGPGVNWLKNRDKNGVLPIRFEAARELVELKISKYLKKAIKRKFTHEKLIKRKNQMKLAGALV